MKETILIVGSGAREHAIALALSRSRMQPQLVCFSGAKNPGIDVLCAAYGLGSITDPAAVAALAVSHHVTLAIVGPEAPLAAGVADTLWASGIPTIGPTQSLARIESSKSFTRDLLTQYNIPGNPFFQRFGATIGYEAGLHEVLERYPQHVIKDDGLAGGKGVKVYGEHLHSIEDSLAFCSELVSAGRPFVIEEKVEGEEFSLMSFCDGTTIRHMPAVQDHKRAFVGDKGPNTGGMGTYTDGNHSLPFLIPADVAAAQSINQRVMLALGEEAGAPYQGILYGGFMATANGVKLIEYNARFGDPESLNLLTLLQDDFVSICRAIADRTLAEQPVRFAPLASVCKYIVPEGYPDTPRRGDLVQMPALLPTGVTAFLSAVDVRDGQLIATGSRTVAVVATGATLADAEAKCEYAVKAIPGRFFHRADIGTSALIEQRVQHMSSLRASQTVGTA